MVQWCLMRERLVHQEIKGKGKGGEEWGFIGKSKVVAYRKWKWKGASGGVMKKRGDGECVKIRKLGNRKLTVL